MQRNSSSQSVRLLIARSGLTADIVLPADADAEHLAYDWCLIMLQEASIEITDEVSDRLKQTLASYVPGEELRAQIAVGVPVQHGIDGHIEWEPNLEPTELEDEQADDPSEAGIENAPPDAVCFYSRCAFTMVNKGQKIGTLVQPTPGVPGRDVRGLEIPAREGRPIKVKLDESIEISEDGVMTSSVDGVLSRSGIRFAVREFLEVPGNVDFSTGHIDFEGDAKIRKGVRDLFEVRATGNIEIGQLIEAATIKAGGDIFAHGGIAGRERGKISSKGDTTIRYLDSSEISVGGVLRFEREMINCKATVMGNIESPGGSIIGGEITVVGRMVVAVIGSNSHVITTIHAGSVPTLQEKLRALDQVVNDLESKEDKIKRALARMAEPGRILSEEDKSRVRQLAGDMKSLQAQRGKCEATHRELAERIETIRTVDISVEKTLHAGVQIAVGNQIFRISKDLKGPLRILLDHHGDMVYRIGTRGKNLPLRLISEVRATAAAAAA